MKKEVTFKIGDIVQVEDWPDGSGSPSVWSQPYKIYDILSPDDDFCLGYSNGTSYWMASLDDKWQRTIHNTSYMRHI